MTCAENGAIVARQLYDGRSDRLHRDQVIELAGGRIAALRPATAADARAGGPEFDLVAPGFLDLQINGAGDTQFNFDPTASALGRIAAAARRGGTAHLLPTFITAPGRAYLRAIEAAQDALRAGIPGILGLHLEGPFLSPDRPGIHDPAAIRVLQDADLALITGAPLLREGAGTLLLTLAPETLPEGALAALCRAGVRVFAGHSAATADQIARAEAQGLAGATHLFNAMSQMTGREPGVVGAVLTSSRLFAGIIADGHHVDWRNIALAARLMPDRLCLVTDAMLTLAGRQTGFELHGERIELREGRLTNAEGRLAGAHVSLIECLRNLRDRVGLDLPAALAMVTANPARALGRDHELGAIRPGYRASLSCLTRDLEVAGVMIDGRWPDRS